MKMKITCFDIKMHLSTLLLIVSVILCTGSIKAQDGVTVTFQVDMTELIKEGKSLNTVGLRGSNLPLSWEKNLILTDANKDGIYERTVKIKSPKSLEYKFVLGSGEEVVWESIKNRKLLESEGQSTMSAMSIWDSNLSLSKSELLAYKVTSQGLQEDLMILQKALYQLHPGLTKHISTADLAMEFEKANRTFRSSQTYREAYKVISELVAKIQCGHTMTGAYNQSEEIEEVILNQKDKLPFSTRIIEDKMYIHRNVSKDERLMRGTEIKSINGVTVSDILQGLMTMTNADGANDAMRLKKMEVIGYGEQSTFDLYYTLLYPLSENVYELSLQDPATQKVYSSSVKPLTFDRREQLMSERYPNIPTSYDDLWSLSYPTEDVALLRLGTFVVWKMDMDWKKFMLDVFKEINAKNIQHLIVDIRGNGGGLDEPSAILMSHIIKEPLSIKSNQPYAKYTRVSEELRPYLKTWGNDSFDISDQVSLSENGLYKNKRADFAFTVNPAKDVFKGETYVLVDASNSSATYILSKTIKANKVATLVGQQTGGNLRGINGGKMFFLELPNSKIEVDIPLWGEGPRTGQPNRGVNPDIVVKKTIQDLTDNVDSEVEAVLSLIKNNEHH